MKKLLVTLMTILLMVGTVNMVGAATIDFGDLIGTYIGNEWNNDYLKTDGEPLYISVDASDTDKVIDEDLNLDWLAKYDVDTSSFDPADKEFDLDSIDNMSGTWTATFDVDYYSVKTANFVGFALYYVGAKDGDTINWHMYDLKDEDGKSYELSHLTLWGDPNDTSAVPEPSTIILLSSGLLGLVFLRRRMKK